MANARKGWRNYLKPDEALTYAYLQAEIKTKREAVSKLLVVARRIQSRANNRLRDAEKRSAKDGKVSKPNGLHIP